MAGFSLAHFIRDKWRGKEQGLSERVRALEMEVVILSMDSFSTLFLGEF